MFVVAVSILLLFHYQPTVQYDMPQVDISQSGNVTSFIGKSTALRCRVVSKANYTVSWIRHADLHLLTVGHYTYTSDQRFRALHEASTGDWVLHIKHLQIRDKGYYECQIGTTPPIGHFVFLDIREPETTLLGGPDIYVNLGSPLNLTCVVLYRPTPTDITWYQGGSVLGHTSSRGGVSVVTESGEYTKSSLLISQSTKKDEGNYTCLPDEENSASTNVHVIVGEYPAAMYSRGQTSPRNLNPIHWLVSSRRKDIGVLCVLFSILIIGSVLRHNLAFMSTF